MGKLLALPANVRLGWKEIASYKHSSLFSLGVSDEEKEFCNLDTRMAKLSGMNGMNGEAIEKLKE